MRADFPPQGPKSLEFLPKRFDPADARQILRLNRNQLCEVKVAGINVIVSRTGYTGEKMAFELFVHPDQAVALWNALMQAGEPLGLKPCGLGARDSLRTEAGLAVFGQGMGGGVNLGGGQGGLLNFVKMKTTLVIRGSGFPGRGRDPHGGVVGPSFINN